ncbi:hypothetical protein CISIN_1g0401212mg, partial [Citrus sinensis]
MRSGCRLPFNNFKRKRHNCYNYGMVFCHSSSSKKTLKASMAPNPNKPYRICDNCFSKLRKAFHTDDSSHSSVSRRGSINQGPNEFIDKDEKLGSRSRAQLARFSSMEYRVAPIPNGSTKWRALNIPKPFNAMFGSSKKFFSASVPGSRIVSRATSPISRQPSPPRSTTPTPTLGGPTSPKILVDDAKRTNDRVGQEVENHTRKAQLQEVELERTTKQLKEAIAIAGEETAKCKAAKEVIKSLTAQLKDMAERLPVGTLRNIKSPTFTFFSSSPPSIDVSSRTGSNNLLLSNGSSTASNRSSKQCQSEAATRNGSRTKEGESSNDNEWIEQDDPGGYIALTSLPGGLNYLKRVRF